MTEQQQQTTVDEFLVELAAAEADWVLMGVGARPGYLRTKIQYGEECGGGDCPLVMVAWARGCMDVTNYTPVILMAQAVTMAVADVKAIVKASDAVETVFDEALRGRILEAVGVEG